MDRVWTKGMHSNSNYFISAFFSNDGTYLVVQTDIKIIVMQTSNGSLVNAIRKTSSSFSTRKNAKINQISSSGDMYMSAYSNLIFKIPALTFQSSPTWAYSLSTSMTNLALELDEINSNLY